MSESNVFIILTVAVGAVAGTNENDNKCQLQGERE